MNIAKRPELLGARRKQLPFLGPGIFASPGPFSCVETNEEAARPCSRVDARAPTALAQGAGTPGQTTASAPPHQTPQPPHPAQLLKHLGMRQYWRDFDALEAWARSTPHREWWRDFLRPSRGTGFWHEAYFMRGGMEAVYDDVPVRLGFGQFAPMQSARGPMFSARNRAKLAGEPLAAATTGATAATTTVTAATPASNKL